ncbi:MAG: nucleotidyltransferase family protein [Chitinophagaceae bacterium]|nr:nucleotidyltransferase family protein [Chitinophagaceae bacterium]
MASKVTEAIILAGGLGTRLRSAVPDLPKCMAPVNGKPFVGYVIESLRRHGIARFIFALGYKSETFDNFLNTVLHKDEYVISLEDEPLGTGGAVRLACNVSLSKNVLVTNGDTLFKADIQQVAIFHESKSAACTLTLKPMKHFDRYGAVELDAEGRVKDFKEKQYFTEGLINGGVYLLNVNEFQKKSFSEKFSFEKDYLEKYYPEGNIYGMAQDAYFIDIGIPEDYERAQYELKQGND